MRLEKDEFGNQNLINEKINYQVMMGWEKPYMEKLVDNLQPFGHVLEIGYGMGFSANAIQNYNIESHTIVELNKDIYDSAKIWAEKQSHKTEVINNSWQKALPTLGKYDCIFFDDSPNELYQDFLELRIFEFYNTVLGNNVNKGCRMTWYAGSPIFWIVNSFVDWECKEVDVQIPENCEYVNEQTKKTQKMYMPKITFTKGIVNNITPFAIDKNLKPLVLPTIL